MVACRSYKAMVRVRFPHRVRWSWCRGLARLIVAQEVPVRYRLIAPSVGGRMVNAAACKAAAHVALVVRIHPGALGSCGATDGTAGSVRQAACSHGEQANIYR